MEADVAHAKVERDELLDTLKEEKTKERILARRLERERASEADCVGAKRATESAREEVTRRESEEE